MGSIPGLVRSPGGRYGNPLQYCCQKNPRDQGARWATVHRVTKSQTQLKQLSTQDTQLELAIFHRNLEGHCSLDFQLFFFFFCRDRFLFIYAFPFLKLVCVVVNSFLMRFKIPYQSLPLNHAAGVKAGQDTWLCVVGRIDCHSFQMGLLKGFGGDRCMRKRKHLCRRKEKWK